LEVFDLKGEIQGLKMKIEWKDLDLRVKDVNPRIMYKLIEEAALLESKNKRLEAENSSKEEKINHLREENKKLREELKRSEKRITIGFITFVSIGIIFIVAKFFSNKKVNSKKITPQNDTTFCQKDNKTKLQ